MRLVRLTSSVVLIGCLLEATPARAGFCPDVMWVVDKSAAMSNDPGGGGNRPSKWELVQMTLVSAFFTFNDRIPMGLEPFSSLRLNGTASCFDDTVIAFPLGKGNVGNVLRGLNAVTGAGFNNAGDAVRRAALDGMLTDGRRDNLIILLTTGKPDCNPDDANGAKYTVGEIARARAQKPSVRTVVIGFDEKDPAAIANLNAMALAGGAAQANCVAQKVPCYYPVNDNVTLAAAFNSILTPYAKCDDTCLGNGCPNGQLCTLQAACGLLACSPDPCANQACGAGRYCREGKCLAPCPHCADDETCVGEKCVANPCPKKMRDQCTGSGLVCDPATGGCAADLCARGRSCPLPMFCDALTGCCALDPCKDINCPPNATCYGGYCMTDPPPPDLSMPDLVDVPIQLPDLWHVPTVDLGPPEPASSGCACAVGRSTVASSGELALLILGVMAHRLARRKR